MTEKIEIENAEIVQGVDVDVDVTLENKPEEVQQPKAKGRPSKKTQQEVVEKPKVGAITPVSVSNLQTEDAPKQFHDIVQGVAIGELGLGFYPLNEYAELPKFETEQSACFDIRVNLKGVKESGQDQIKVWNRSNQQIVRRIETDVATGELYVDLRPNERILAPTGFIIDIPQGYSVKVHPRSGTALTQGINLINQEGIIDADYVEELFLPLVNSSENHVRIYHGLRYAQAELQQVIQPKIKFIKEKPTHKTTRVGGFGHTGVN